MAVDVRVDADGVSAANAGWARRLLVPVSTILMIVSGLIVLGGLATGVFGFAAEGLLLLAVAVSMYGTATASVRVSNGLLQYRYGLFRRQIAASDIVGFQVKSVVLPTSGRVALVLPRTVGRPQRIRLLPQLDTYKNRQALGEAGRELALALEIGGQERDQ